MQAENSMSAQKNFYWAQIEIEKEKMKREDEREHT